MLKFKIVFEKKKKTHLQALAGEGTWCFLAVPSSQDHSVRRKHDFVIGFVHLGFAHLHLEGIGRILRTLQVLTVPYPVHVALWVAQL